MEHFYPTQQDEMTQLEELYPDAQEEEAEAPTRTAPATVPATAPRKRNAEKALVNCVRKKAARIANTQLTEAILDPDKVKNLAEPFQDRFRILRQEIEDVAFDEICDTLTSEAMKG